MEVRYSNEKEFHKMEIALKKYAVLAYDALYKEVYPSLKNGDFVGEVSSYDLISSSYTYELPATKLFKEVQGKLNLHYTVYPMDGYVVLDTIEPIDKLLKKGLEKVTSYKGVMISKKNEAKDKFKINLLHTMDLHDKEKTVD